MAKYYVEVEWNGFVNPDGDAFARLPDRSTYLSAGSLIPAERVTVATPEPTGLGAVVEDAEGDLWVRVEHDLWHNPDYLLTTRDELLGPLTVLSEGYTNGDH